MIFDKVSFRCPSCFLCKHNVEKKCKAYPNGIPKNIITESMFFKEGHECAKGVYYEYKKDND